MAEAPQATTPAKTAMPPKAPINAQEGPQTAPEGLPTTLVRTPSGGISRIATGQVEAAYQQGYTPISEEDAASEDKMAHYGTLGEQAKTIGEGVGRGVAGPAFTALEEAAGANPEDIRARQETNPIESGVSELGGFIAPAIISGGESAIRPFTQEGVVSKIGQAVGKATGLGGEGASTLSKVGYNAAKMAAESGILQSGTEINKALINDPDYSAQSAVANVGLSSLLGGALGGAIGGLGKVSGLWKATEGAKLEPLMSDLQAKATGAGVEIPSVLSAAMAGDEKANQLLSLVRNTESKSGASAEAAIQKLYKQANDNVASVFDKSPSEIGELNNYELGSKAKSAIEDSVKAGKEQYSPAYKEILSKYNKIPFGNEDQSLLASKIAKAATDNGLTSLRGSESTKAIQNIVDSVKDFKNANDLKLANTQIWKAAINPELKHVASVVSPLFKDAESSIVKNHLESLGEAPALLARRASADAAYKQAMQDTQELNKYVHAGNFHGPDSFLQNLSEKSPEKLLNALKDKNNVEMTKFLQEKFPAVSEAVRNAHIEELMNKSTSKNGEFNSSKFLQNLNNQKLIPSHIRDQILGKLPESKVKQLQMIEDILKAVPEKSNPSGTAKTLNLLLKDKFSTLLGAIGLGHGGVLHGIAGMLGGNIVHEAAPYLNYKMLELMGKDTKIIPSSLKAIIGYANNAALGDKLLTKATNSIFNANASANIHEPDKKQLEKLDSYLEKLQNDPSLMQNISSDLSDGTPDHMGSIGALSSRALNYLQSLKPQVKSSGILDTPHKISNAAQGAYDRQLSLAESPLTILKNIKNGNLQAQDVATIKIIYPRLYDKLSEKLMSGLVEAKQNNETVPYKTKQAISLFMAQPIDSTFSSQSILAAQPKPSQPLPQQNSPQKGVKSAPSLQKMSSMSLTPGQAAAKDHQSR